MDDMKVNIKGVSQYRDRHGKLRTRYRANGVHVPLPDPSDPKFMDALEVARKARPTIKNADQSGTVKKAMDLYYASPKYANLAPKTKYEVSRRLAELLDKNSHLQLDSLTPELVREMQAKRADKPAMANVSMRYLRSFLNWCVKARLIADNPASGIDMYKTGEWRAWTLDECARFEAKWPTGTPQRRLYVLLRFAGQRVGDTARMTLHDRSDGFISVVQEKTKEKLEIFEHPDITAELDLLPKNQIPFFLTTKGDVMSSEYASKMLKAAARAAKLSEDCKAHGLRKRAATDLAEAGCNDRQIMAITGHRSKAMVEHYTKAIEQKGQSKVAILKLSKNK